MPMLNHTGWGFQIDDSIENGFYNLSEQDLLKLHILQREMLRHLITFFEKNKIHWFLAGGTSLGAVRHQGFIPWDDDIDICLPRSDYNFFIDLLDKSDLANIFHIVGPTCRTYDHRHYLRLYIKGTIWKEIFDNGYDEIPIDIFPVESVPKQGVKKIFRIVMSILLERISSCVYFFEQRKNENVKKYLGKTYRHNRNTFVLNAFLGFFFSFLSSGKWSKIFDWIVADSSSTSFLTIPSGRNEYVKEIQPYGVFFPTSYGIFEGIKVRLPNNCHEYLSKLYGKDYMKIPAENKREHHRPIKFLIAEHLLYKCSFFKKN